MIVYMLFCLLKKCLRAVLWSCCYYELGIQKAKEKKMVTITLIIKKILNISFSYKGTSGALNYHFIFFCTSA